MEIATWQLLGKKLNATDSRTLGFLLGCSYATAEPQTNKTTRKMFLEINAFLG